MLIWTGSPRAFKVCALSRLCTCWSRAQHLEPSRFHEIIINGINASENDDNLQYLHHALYFQDFLLTLFTFPQEHWKLNKLYYIDYWKRHWDLPPLTEFLVAKLELNSQSPHHFPLICQTAPLNVIIHKAHFAVTYSASIWVYKPSIPTLLSFVWPSG